ncbi:YdgA family protein [Kushneria sp. AK178]
MKRKVAISLMALGVLALVLWLGALAWSRHEVRSRMAERVADIGALSGVRAINAIENDGFFSSRGTLRVIMADSDAPAPAAVIDWRVNYGVLSTRFSGQGDLETREGRALLADELSDGDQVSFDARIRHLQHGLTLNARLPAHVHYQKQDSSFFLSDAGLRVTDDDRGLHLEGQWSALARQSPLRHVRLGETHWSMRFPARDDASVSDSDSPGRLDTVDISAARLQRQGGLPLTLSDLHVEGSTHHDQQELSYLLTARLGNTAFSEQQLGSASLDAAIRRINEPAARALLQTIARDIKRRWKTARERPAPGQGAPQSVDDGDSDTSVHDPAALMASWQQDLFAVLSDSPRLVIHQLRLDSPMLDQQMHLEGELTLDGTDIASSRIERLKTSWGRAAFKRRLDGQFTLHNAPPLLALVAGQAPEQGTLELAIRKGVFLINDEPWFLLN